MPARKVWRITIWKHRQTWEPGLEGNILSWYTSEKPQPPSYLHRVIGSLEVTESRLETTRRGTTRHATTPSTRRGTARRDTTRPEQHDRTRSTRHDPTRTERHDATRCREVKKNDKMILL